MQVIYSLNQLVKLSLKLLVLQVFLLVGNVANANQYTDSEDFFSAIWVVNQIIKDPVKKPDIDESYDVAIEDVFADIAKNYVSKKPVIVIDAGHGGRDPGAIGHGRIQEKDLVLNYARFLRDALVQTGKYQIYMTRNGDRFLHLRHRTAIARKYNADMFISLHADAAKSKKARGLSIYTLSETASNKEAALLAQKENQAGLVAGFDIADEFEDDVFEALLDLSLVDAQNKSRLFAKMLHSKLKPRVLVKRNALHFAGFVVLKNANMPSVLIEIGYISNAKDAANLKKSAYKKQIITGIVEGVETYFASNQAGADYFASEKE